MARYGRYGAKSCKSAGILAGMSEYGAESCKNTVFFGSFRLSGLNGSKILHNRSNFRVLVFLRPKILHFCSIVQQKKLQASAPGGRNWRERPPNALRTMRSRSDAQMRNGSAAHDAQQKRCAECATEALRTMCSRSDAQMRNGSAAHDAQQKRCADAQQKRCLAVRCGTGRQDLKERRREGHAEGENDSARGDGRHCGV